MPLIALEFDLPPSASAKAREPPRRSPNSFHMFKQIWIHFTTTFHKENTRSFLIFFPFDFFPQYYFILSGFVILLLRFFRAAAALSGFDAAGKLRTTRLIQTDEPVGPSQSPA